MDPHNLLLEMLLVITSIPVVMAWLLIKTMTLEPFQDVGTDDDDKDSLPNRRPLVIERTRQEVLETVIEMPIDEDMEGI